MKRIIGLFISITLAFGLGYVTSEVQNNNSTQVDQAGCPGGGGIGGNCTG